MSYEEEISMEKIHAAGVKRHPRSWFTANQKAVTGLIGAVVEGYTPSGSHKRTFSFDVSLPKNKVMVSRLVLRVLDALEAP